MSAPAQAVPGRARRRRAYLGLGAATLAVLGAAAFALALTARPDASAPGGWLTARATAAAPPLLLRGALGPIEAVNISAPVDAVLLAKYAQVGDAVTAGQPLARVGDSELRRQLREAEMAAIQARQALGAARRLETGTEYQAATRRLLAARNTLAAARGRGAETQRLYDKGIIARTELDAAQQEIDAAQGQVDGAGDEIATLELKRSGGALRVLELEMENRRLQLAELGAKLTATTMRAPLSGVVLYPVGGDGADAAPAREFNPGASVTTKDVLMTVGDTSSFVIKAWVDEQDARQITPGQRARVVLDADPDAAFAGVVRRVSSQARAGDSRGQGGRGGAECEVQIVLTPAPGARQRLRVGSGVGVAITPLPGPAVVRVPLAALGWDADGQPVVRVRAAAGRAGGLRAIAVGKTTADSVEVKSGVAAGEQVWVPAAAAPAPAAAGALGRLLSAGGHD